MIYVTGDIHGDQILWDAYAYYKRISINRKQFMQRIIKREFSDFEKYKDSKAKEILSLSFLPV